MPRILKVDPLIVIGFVILMNKVFRTDLPVKQCGANPDVNHYEKKLGHSVSCFYDQTLTPGGQLAGFGSMTLEY
jgi:hypothetical protein